MSARIPSCIRAPPEAETETSGTPASAALSHARTNFSPTTLPIEPPMNAKSMTASRHGCSFDRRAADDHRVAEPGLDLRLGQPLRVRPQVEEAEDVRGAQLLVLLDERPGIDELLDPLARADREVVPALRAHAQALRRARRRGSASRSRGTCSGCALPAAWSGGRLSSTETSTRPWSVDDMRWILCGGLQRPGGREQPRDDGDVRARRRRGP